jgi:beta-glucanase (GH16 family)
MSSLDTAIVRIRPATVLAGLFGAAVLLLCAPASAQQKDGWTLTFSDEFDESALDTTKWGTFYKWGQSVVNSELQAYVDTAFTFSDGVMTINGLHQQGTYAGQTLDYTSGLIASVYEQQFGYFEMRAKLPSGQGLLPAFWLLHTVSEPDIKEVDIFEVLGQTPSKLYTTVHWGTSYSTDNHQQQQASTVADMTADFHVYGLEWTADKLVWSFDGSPVHTYTGTGVPQVPMYVIANLAIGGTWPGNPSTATTFPALLQIDYVRVYQAADAGDGDAAASDDASTDEDAGNLSEAGALDASVPAPDASTVDSHDSGSKSLGSYGSSTGCSIGRESNSSDAPWATIYVGVGLAISRRTRRPSPIRRRRSLEIR